MTENKHYQKAEIKPIVVFEKTNKANTVTGIKSVNTYNMLYSFSSLTTIAGCDELINDCGREKTALENRKNNILAKLSNDDATSSMSARINFLNLRVQATEALIAQNPPEEDLQQLQIELGEFIKERAQLERKMDSIGENWRIEAVFEVNSCDAQIALRDALIAELNAYKATLPAAA